MRKIDKGLLAEVGHLNSTLSRWVRALFMHMNPRLILIKIYIIRESKVSILSILVLVDYSTKRDVF